MMKTNVEVPIRCTGVAVVLLKNTPSGHHVLLLKRAGSVLTDAWCYIGGGIEAGEQAWEAALREIREETGITRVALYTSNTFDQIYSAKENYIYVAPVFVGYVDETQEVMLNHEHSDYEWLPVNEAIERAALPGNDAVLASVGKHFIKKTPAEWLRVGTP